MAGAVTLTDAKIMGLKPPSKGQVEIIDKVVSGLRVRIGASGVKSFIVRKRVGGKIKVVTLGRYGARFTLADARKAAQTALNDIDAGKDIIPVRRGSMFVKSLWVEYIATKAGHRSIGEIKRIGDKHILPALGERFADAVTRGDVTRFIDSIRAPVMARATHAQLSAFYTWALPRLDKLEANPCQGAGRPSKPKPRERVLSDVEVAALWKAVDTQPEPWRSAIKMLLLTGQRRSEVFEAKRHEFDLKASMWTIPAHKAKNGNTSLVHLSPAAKAVVEGIVQGEESDWLFPAEGNPDNPASGISRAVKRLREAVKAQLGDHVPQWSLHDIRRTVATGLQRLGIRLEVTEAVLNHVSGSKGGIAGVYQRYDWADEKRSALDAWAAELQRILDGAKADSVVKLRG
jgi:integrase